MQIVEFTVQWDLASDRKLSEVMRLPHLWFVAG